jgi:hypothetical protein
MTTDHISKYFISHTWIKKSQVDQICGRLERLLTVFDFGNKNICSSST